MEEYISIAGRGTFTYEDRKSVFIGEAAPTSEESGAIEFIREIKKRYPDAKHHVYAYRIRNNSISRYSDDREPQGTAGLPVLEAVAKAGYTDVSVVVVRYFGGILLGTGGLVRAYTSAAKGALENAGKIVFSVYSYLSIVSSYQDYGKILPVLQSAGFSVSDTVFADTVTVTGKIRSDESDSLIKSLTETSCGKCRILKIEEKFDFI